MLPPIAYYVTYRVCLGLQRADRAILEHGIETGIIKRLRLRDHRSATLILHPRRARCVACGATQVLLSGALRPRRADTTTVIGFLRCRSAGLHHVRPNAVNTRPARGPQAPRCPPSRSARSERRRGTLPAGRFAGDPAASWLSAFPAHGSPVVISRRWLGSCIKRSARPDPSTCSPRSRAAGSQCPVYYGSPRRLRGTPPNRWSTRSAELSGSFHRDRTSKDLEDPVRHVLPHS